VCFYEKDLLVIIDEIWLAMSASQYGVEVGSGLLYLAVCLMNCDRTDFDATRRT